MYRAATILLIVKVCIAHCYYMQDPVIISEICEYNTTLYYKAFVDDNEANFVISKEVTSTDCNNHCRITLSAFGGFDFNITLIAVNAVGQSSNTTREIPIGKYEVSSFVLYCVIACFT